MRTIEAQDALRHFAHTRDADAFAHLVRADIDLVYAAARRQVSDPAAADDVVQSVFILLARKAARFPAGTLLPGWLLLTTRYCASEANRSMATRRRHEREAAAMKPQMVDSTVGSGEILLQVDTALAQLGEKDRTAIAMRYLQEASMHEIAQALSTTEDAAKKRVARAMDRLRGKLSPLRGAITVAALATALEESTSVTAPTALAGVVATTAVSAANVLPAVTFPLASWIIGWGLGAAIVAIIAAAVLLHRPSTKPVPIAASPPATTSPFVGPRNPMPALASLSPQKRRIYELIFDFRNEIAPSRPEEWISTLRELTQIGSAAVPALCAELDGTSSDENSAF